MSADSSLSSSLPVAGSFFIPGSKYAEEAVNKASDDKPSEKDPSTTDGSTTNSTLEMDELNATPCMSAVLRTIDHMVSIFKYPSVVDYNTAMPSWMAEMHKKLLSDILLIETLSFIEFTTIKFLYAIIMSLFYHTHGRI